MTIVLHLALNVGCEEACLLCAADTSGYEDTQGRSYASWVPQEARLFPEGILRISGEHNSLSGTASLSAQQQALLVQAMLDTRQASHLQCIQKLSAAEQGEEVHSYDQTWGWNPIASPPGFLCTQHLRVEMSVSNLHPLLSVMASLLDNVASDYVFGAMNTIGRPRGYITLETICEMDDDKQLSKVQHHRWLQFLQVWENAGWGCSDVILLTEELRPLQYGHPQPQAQTAKVGANQMLKCISSYGNSQGHRRFKLKESLIRSLNVVQQNFSSPGTVLLRDPDVNARLSKVQMNGHFVVAEDIAPVSCAIRT